MLNNNQKRILTNICDKFNPLFKQCFYLSPSKDKVIVVLINFCNYSNQTFDIFN